jgi:hypothetical protein
MVKALIQRTLQRVGLTLARVPTIPIASYTEEAANAYVKHEVVSEIAGFFKAVQPFYEDSTPPPLQIGGAWLFDLNKRRKNQLKAIQTGDWDSYQRMLNNLFRSELILGMWNYGEYGEARTIPQELLDDIQSFEIETGRPIKDLIRPQRFASDWGLRVDDGIIKFVDPYHGKQAQRVINALSYLEDTGGMKALSHDGTRPQVLVDLGSGFGGMASYLKRWSDRPMPLMLVDIPLNVTTAYAYLAAEFPDVPVRLVATIDQLHAVAGNLARDSIVLIPTILLEAAVRVVQPIIVHNSASFSEMDLATVEYYLHLFGTAKAKIIIETNSGQRGSRNAGGHMEITAWNIQDILASDYSLISRARSGNTRYVTSIYFGRNS